MSSAHRMFIITSPLLDDYHHPPQRPSASSLRPGRKNGGAERADSVKRWEAIGEHIGTYASNMLSTGHFTRKKGDLI